MTDLANTAMRLKFAREVLLNVQRGGDAEAIREAREEFAAASSAHGRACREHLRRAQGVPNA
jgi:hypothetical protein